LWLLLATLAVEPDLAIPRVAIGLAAATSLVWIFQKFWCAEKTGEE
jgi:hypothetical protein